MEGEESRAALRTKSAEIAVAALFFLFGAIIIWDSVRLGWTWGTEGPQPGYFPFYVALIICVSAAINMLRAALIRTEKDAVFVEAGQLKMVLTVLVPTAVYVALVAWIGIYVASALFIASFMRWLGKYRWWKVAAVSAGTAVVLFLIFELWFKVPLPKGPLESWLKLD